jgi:hypothetical protein
MTDAIRTFAHLHLAVLLTMLGTAPALAQQRPITGQMLGEQPPPPPRAPPEVVAVPAAPAPVVLALPARPQLGDTTRALLQLQASGEHAGTPHTVLGDQASRSYARYLESFNHPIPEYLEHSVRKDVSGSSEGGD